MSLKLCIQIFIRSFSVKQGIFYHKHNNFKGPVRLLSDDSVFLIAKSVTFP